jgi:hypothetical protein
MSEQSNALQEQSPAATQIPTFAEMMVLFQETREQIAELRLAQVETDRQMKATNRQMKETDRQMKETNRQMKETDRQMKATDRKIDRTNEQVGRITDHIGDLVASMVEGGVIRLFQALGYTFSRCSPRMRFGLDVNAGKKNTKNTRKADAGEVDLFLENGELALLVEVKTNLSVDDIKEHVNRLEKYRKYADAHGDRRQFLAAVGGGVVSEGVEHYALERGFFVIRQSGENVMVIPPHGKPRIW